MKNTSFHSSRAFFIGLVSIVLLSLAGLSSVAQAIPEKLDTLIAAYHKQGAFNGSVLVAQKGAILLEKGVGYKNRTAGTLNDANSIFQIGSVTKQFTSAIILQLQEKKKLSVQDKLSKYIPGYPHGDEISIFNLLTHTAGVYNYTENAAFMTQHMTAPIARDSLLAVFSNHPLGFSPGEKFSYSNSGYILLGVIIEKVTGKSYFRVVREQIFQPLHMEHSGFDFAALKSADKATGYTSPVMDQPAPTVDSSVSFSAGALYTTLGDLYKWDRALSGGRVMSQASLEMAFTPFKSKYGFGWAIDSLYGERVVEHGGSIPGFTSEITRIPATATCIILLDNHQSAVLGKIAGDINAVLNNKPYELPKEKKEITVDTTILRQYAGEYELAPGFKIIIALKDGKLTATPTGQGTAALFAERDNLFFLKVVDAEVEFVKGSDGKIEKMVLYQNGQQIPGKKVR